MIYNDLFPEKDCTAIQNWYPTHERAAEKLEYRQIPPQKVKTVFYGDSITYNFQRMGCLSTRPGNPATARTQGVSGGESDSPH